MKSFITADWAPHIEAAVRSIAAIAAFVYTAGYCTGQWLHRLNDSTTALLVRRPRRISDLITDSIKTVEAKASTAPVVGQVRDYSLNVQRQAAVPHRAAIAAPRVHPAVTLAASGLSQRAIAAKLGCTRYEVRKALRG